MTDTTKKPNREIKSGQYTYKGGFERMCRCGHTLGAHSAERARVDGRSIQECFHPDGCDCQCFKPTRAK